MNPNLPLGLKDGPFLTFVTITPKLVLTAVEASVTFTNDPLTVHVNKALEIKS